MSAFDLALLRIAGWAGMADDRKAELLADARLASAGPRSGPLRELWAVIGLGLQLRSLRATAGDPVLAFRQGAHLGATLALACAFPLVVGAAAHSGRLWMLALLVGPTVAWFAFGAPVARSIVLAVATAALVVFARTSGADSLVITLLLVAHGGLAIGDRGWRSRALRVRCTVGVVASMCAIGWLAATADLSVVVPVVQVVGIGVVPGAMLVAGRLDPRLAVAATAVIVARFGTFDRADLVALADGGDVVPVVLRCALMMSFVVAGALATRSAIRHHTRI